MDHVLNGEYMRLTALLPFLCATLAAMPAAAQSFQKHHITGGLGVAIPQDELRSVYKNGVAWTVGYGYRPFRHLQFDAALDTVYNSADVRDYVSNPIFGYLRIRDFEFLVPLGARLVLPVANGKANLYGGGGGAYMRYTERLRQPSEFYNIECPACQARDGWGYYFLAGGDVALTSGGAIRLGVTMRVYQGTTDGRSVGNVPPIETKDRWVNTFAHLTFSF